MVFSMSSKGTHFLSFLTGYLQLLKGQSFKNMGDYCFLNELDIVGKSCIKRLHTFAEWENS